MVLFPEETLLHLLCLHLVHTATAWDLPRVLRILGWLLSTILGAITTTEGSDWVQTSRCSRPYFSDSNISTGLRQQSWGMDGELSHVLFAKGICMTSLSGDSLPGASDTRSAYPT